MTAAPTGSSLFRQLVVPVAGLVLAAVLANVGFAAFLAARRSLAAARAAEQQVTRAIAGARVPLAPPVLAALHALTGSHFVVRDAASGAVNATTLPAAVAARLDAAALAAAAGGVAVVDGRRYRVGTARAGGPRPESVLVLTPLRDGLATTLEAVWPVLAVAAATLAVLVPLGLVTTSRLAGRIAAVERHVGRIARGEFGEVLPAAPEAPDDEVTRLAAGVDRMSLELAALRDRLVAGERQRLLGQLAAGFAHELRNAVTGARLAIELHARRCAGGAADDGLGVAIRQLGIVEEEVRGLLALGGPARAEPAAFTAVDLAGLCAEVADLVGPRCAHGGVRLAIAAPPVPAIAGRRDGLRAALVNLAINGIDAAGRGGHVTLTADAAADAVTIAVEDDGPGPPAALAATLAEPFVTGKPEGIGLGLAVARAVAEDHGGRLEWRRVADRTRFALVLPTGGPLAGEQRG